VANASALLLSLDRLGSLMLEEGPNRNDIRKNAVILRFQLDAEKPFAFNR